MNAEFASPEAVGRAIEAVLKADGLDLVGYADARGRLICASFEKLPELLPLDKQMLLHFIAGNNPAVEAGVLWFPPTVFDCFVSPRARLDLSLGFSTGWEWQAAEHAFVSAIRRFSPHWGELNRLSSTKLPTLCNLQGHHYCIPHLGTMNYFGPEYCDFFGGVERMKSATFASVTTVHEGALVSLGVDLDNENYKAKRAEVESKLASPKIFDPNSTSPLPRLRM